MSESQSIFSWYEIIGLIASTGIVSALINQALSYLRESWVHTKINAEEAVYISIIISTSLEKYSIECAKKISDNDLYISSGGHAGSVDTDFLCFKIPNENLNWRTLNSKLLMRIFSLINDFNVHKNSYNFIVSELCYDEIDAIGAFNTEIAKCGLMAFEIARDLRIEYNLPEFRFVNLDWDIQKTLKSKIE